MLFLDTEVRQVSLVFNPWSVPLSGSHTLDKERTPGFVPALTSYTFFENPAWLLQSASGELRWIKFILLPYTRIRFCVLSFLFLFNPPHAPPVMLNTSISKVYHLLFDMGNITCPKKSCQLQQLLKISSLWVDPDTNIHALKIAFQWMSLGRSYLEAQHSGVNALWWNTGVLREQDISCSVRVTHRSELLFGSWH